MVKSKSVAAQPDYQLKHRLSGAIIVVIIGVLAIPMLLSEHKIDPSIETIATKTNAKTKSTKPVPQKFRLPVTGKVSDTKQPANKNATKQKPAKSSRKVPPADSNKAVTKKTTKAPPKAVNKPVKKATKKVAKKAPAAPAKASPGWAVRAGTFSNLRNAQSVITSLREKGFTVHATPIEINGGEAMRIWLGPYVQRNEAERVGKRLQSLIGEPGYVTKYIP